MTVVSPAREPCPRCGAGAAAFLENGLCARCLIGAALDDVEIAGEGLCGEAPRTIGRYRLLGEIARGGVGVVYRAWQEDLRRTVALKMLLPSRLETSDARDRFRREAEAMASFDHPGILPVYEVGVQDGVPYFSMKLAEGGNLAERIASRERDPRESAQLVASIARAIAHAHIRGVLHRDLKPSNVVFDADDHPLITDFGLARFLAQDSSLTGTDVVIGTPRYAAPEVVSIKGVRITVAADVYGLGAIFYEMLTGDAPFAELTSLEILQHVATRRVRAPREIDPAIPAALESICMRCLEKRPGDRYASAGALADAIDAWLAGAKSSLAARLRWLGFDVPSRRRRGILALALLAALAVAVGAWAYATREPIPIPDPAIATQTVVVLPDLSMGAREDAAARRIAERLKIPLPLRVLPYDGALAIANHHKNPAIAVGSFHDLDLDAEVGAFIAVRVSLQDDGGLAIMAADDLRQESLFEARYLPGDEDRIATEIANTIVAKRAQPTAEAHLSRRALARLLRAVRLIYSRDRLPDAQTALMDVIAESPDSALAHAWLALVYQEMGSLSASYVDQVGVPFWINSSIEIAGLAQRLDPTLGLATSQLAQAYAAKGWFAKATTGLEQAQAQGTVLLAELLANSYLQHGRILEAYEQTRHARFGTEHTDLSALTTFILFMVGETDAGERALRRAMASVGDFSGVKELQEAEIAWYRGDFTLCRLLATPLDPDLNDGTFTASRLIRSCAIEQDDFAGALATTAAPEKVYQRSEWSTSYINDPALPKAILLAEVGRADEVGPLAEPARQKLQVAIDGGNESPFMWLRLAAAQRVMGDIDAAYVTLDRAIALGLTINRKNRGNVDFVPFRNDARFAALRDKAENDLAEYRRDIATVRVKESPETWIGVGQDLLESGSIKPL